MVAEKKTFGISILLLEQFSLEKMIDSHAKRYEWEHDLQDILVKFVDFSVADTEFPPVCLLQKDWDEIKLDLIDIRNNFLQSSYCKHYSHWKLHKE